MKKLAVGVLALFVVYMGATHLWHAVSLDGYIQGCRDTILNAAEKDGLQIPDEVLNKYCQDLAGKYVVGK